MKIDVTVWTVVSLSDDYYISWLWLLPISGYSINGSSIVGTCKSWPYQQCKMKVAYKDDCSKVSKVLPNCSPRRSKCVKGVVVSIHTEKGCTVTGVYKNNGKKQTISKLAISTTTSAPTTITPTTVPLGPARWSEWSDWIEGDPSSCSCGIGFKFRVRHCLNAPSPDSCDGDFTQTEPCTVSEYISQQTCEKPTSAGWFIGMF